MLRQFKQNNVFKNRLKTYPNISFFINNRKIYFNGKSEVAGNHVTNVGCVPIGCLSLYEENVDRESTNLIYPYVTKNGSLMAFKTISMTSFNTDFSYGDTLTGSYPLSASISIDRFVANSSRPVINALENTLNYYKTLSPHYEYDSNSLGDKSSQKLSLISIPSIFYGSSIKKGSIDLKFYVSGTMIGRLQDLKKNGELIQVSPVGSNGSGSIAGVCLYNEGFFVLTGAWDITQEYKDEYIPAAAVVCPQWIYFGSTGSSGAGENIPSSSFSIDFQGTNYINTLTMFCYAGVGEVNCSNNPTFKEYGSVTTPMTSSYGFKEPDNIKIKNTIKSPFSYASASFEKQVFINRVNIYDKDKRVIAIAKLSRPIRKKESEELTFKIKIDLI